MIDEIEWREEVEERDNYGDVVRSRFVLWAKSHDGTWFKVPIVKIIKELICQ